MKRNGTVGGVAVAVAAELNVLDKVAASRSMLALPWPMSGGFLWDSRPEIGVLISGRLVEVAADRHFRFGRNRLEMTNRRQQRLRHRRRSRNRLHSFAFLKMKKMNLHPVIVEPEK